MSNPTQLNEDETLHGGLTPFYRLVNELLGGKSILRKIVLSKIDAHSIIDEGVPTRSLILLIDHFNELDSENILRVVGLSARSYQRRKEEAVHDRGARLSIEVSDRLWRFTELLALAMETLGSKESAEEWFTHNQLGLGGKRPMDLITTAPGAGLVHDLLVRMDYGVYT